MYINHATRLALCWAFLWSSWGGAATLWSDYELNNSLVDSLNPLRSLTANGGTLDATSYSFGANQGLTLSDGLPAPDEYSIEIQFQFATIDSYRKVLDFLGQTVDAGLYVQGGTARLYPNSGGALQVFFPDTPAQLILTRDAATSQVTGYVNGVQQFSFQDLANVAVFSGLNQIATFFMDDSVSGGSEASAGSVGRIRIWSGVLTADEVAGAYADFVGVTEPSSGFLAFAGLFVTLLLVRKRRSENMLT